MPQDTLQAAGQMHPKGYLHNDPRSKMIYELCLGTDTAG